MRHTYRPGITRLQPLDSKLTPAQRRRRHARIEVRRRDAAVRAMRQTSIAAESFAWFRRVLKAPRAFRFPSFSSLFQGNRLARLREQQHALGERRRALKRTLARTAPQKAA